jgi:hypothetical protein
MVAHLQIGVGIHSKAIEARSIKIRAPHYHRNTTLANREKILSQKDPEIDGEK